MPRNGLETIVVALLPNGEIEGGVRKVLDQASEELRPGWITELEGAMRTLSLQLEQLRVTSQAQVEATSDNTAAIIQNTVVQASGKGESTTATVGRAIARVFTSGLGLSPLLSGLVRLFGGGRREPNLPPLQPYAVPASIHFEGVITRGYRESPYGTGWMESEKGTWRGFAGLPGRTPVTAQPLQPLEITVQVQAIDSRSFLDHSEEIAKAVRQAMLNSHCLNDVVTEL